MDDRRVHRTLAAVGLSLVIAACGAATTTSSAPAGVSAKPSSAPATAAASSSVSSPTAAPTPVPIVVAAAPLEPGLKELWRIGGPKPPKDGACCVTIAPDGNAWVSTGFGSSFWIVAADGKHVESWGAQGSGEGQFDFVVKDSGYGAVAFDPDGTFYVADTGNHRVQKFSKNRHFVKTWGTFGTEDGQFATPAIVASDGRGHVYVSDWDRRDIQEFSSDGAFIRTLAAGAKVYFISIDSKGRLYTNDGPTIRVFDIDGKQLPGFDFSATGWYTGGMAFGAAGNIYVSLISTYDAPIVTQAIYEVDASGKVIHAWPGNADSLAVDPKGVALYSSFYVDPFIRKLALPKP